MNVDLDRTEMSHIYMHMVNNIRTNRVKHVIVVNIQIKLTEFVAVIVLLLVTVLLNLMSVYI